MLFLFVQKMINSYLILLGSILFAVVGQILLKSGMNILGPLDLSFKNIIFLLSSIFKNINILIGLFLYSISLIFWLFALSKLKLSVAYPATSLMYVFVILGSWLILKESINIYQIIGIIIILIGLSLLFLKST